MSHINRSPTRGRKKRIRAKVFGTKVRPRLSVFRSNKHTYAQIIDDEQGITLVSANETDVKPTDSKQQKTAKADLIGQAVAKKAIKKGIKAVVFDRGPYRYHGRIKRLAESARKEGLKF
ncbi:MAG: 50S ribosomal protein L18 [Candidatus Chisholmbacteria bacterium RIFCSPLOWO2_01_FULL_50_28]|uniref:Large ribosomal subunit protein uL18 n=1 Tax=Candidatus Chisholmbacteria bacterium RIFCSPHIGHO2_01_FULL_52_32 TaxID=1797591 RepID=A0A1G1VTV9_9BACT|nr:MAG: 50S ribosomal protein L18 [Candidatus Chisholmbacteria bacterium RIFCSPHIGHO2_01_FULL_52_32]OGY19794.1 MAG: 50S ribosomal protein L18 [Candidatus Chisholmbacteria bacterium RIFCSPLOWO2_01_FULL_50_28]